MCAIAVNVRLSYWTWLWLQSWHYCSFLIRWDHVYPNTASWAVISFWVSFSFRINSCFPKLRFYDLQNWMLFWSSNTMKEDELNLGRVLCAPYMLTLTEQCLLLRCGIFQWRFASSSGDFPALERILSSWVAQYLEHLPSIWDANIEVDFIWNRDSTWLSWISALWLLIYALKGNSSFQCRRKTNVWVPHFVPNLGSCLLTSLAF